MLPSLGSANVRGAQGLSELQEPLLEQTTHQNLETRNLEKGSIKQAIVACRALIRTARERCGLPRQQT